MGFHGYAHKSGYIMATRKAKKVELTTEELQALLDARRAEEAAAAAAAAPADDDDDVDTLLAEADELVAACKQARADRQVAGSARQQAFQRGGQIRAARVDLSKEIRSAKASAKWGNEAAAAKAVELEAKRYALLKAQMKARQRAGFRKGQDVEAEWAKLAPKSR